MCDISCLCRATRPHLDRASRCDASASSSAYGTRSHALPVPWLQRGGVGPLRRYQCHKDTLGGRRHERYRPQRPTLPPPMLHPNRKTPDRSRAEPASPVPIPARPIATAGNKDCPNNSFKDEWVSLLENGWNESGSFLLYNYANE
jgi:hypothetical protein